MEEIKNQFGGQGKGVALCQPLPGIDGLEPNNPSLHEVTSSNFQHFINLFDCVFGVLLDAHWYGDHFWTMEKIKHETYFAQRR